MRKILIFLSSVVVASSISSCEKGIEAFDNSTNYIYFDMPFIINQYGTITKNRVDSLVYSFAMDDLSVQEYVFKVPINTIGLISDIDRVFKIDVIDEKTTATDSDWDKSCINNSTIKRGTLQDTLLIQVKRSPAIKTESRTITLSITDNDNFKTGPKELLEAKLSFTDILQQPSWWKTWLRYFGDFSREKYAKWQEIYYLGADPNVARDGKNVGQPYYWDNMPSSAVQSWDPSTFMFIGKLKQYFIENEVYPDGDTSKPRITLP